MPFEILIGDVREQLATLEAESVDCVVTSPPYWGLRDYGVSGQIGMEPTLAEHLEVLVDVFEGVRRALKPSGTLWLNYGDTYAAAPSGHKTGSDGRIRPGVHDPNTKYDDRTFTNKPFSTVQGALKPKDLCMVPNRLAIALQEAGWWVRSEIIWAKPNPMPESIKDRPATSHEKIWLLTKSSRYFYDAEAVREAASPETASRYKYGFNKFTGSKTQTGERLAKGQQNQTRVEKEGRNLRNVWNIATHPFPGAHFATFPPKLAETCIKAGCPKGGLVLDPFGGSGTVALVAERLQRDSILIELNPEYAEIARARIEAESLPMFEDIEPPSKPVQESMEV